MKTAAQTSIAERLGRVLGRTWRGCARLDQRAQGWLRAQGLAPGAARAVSLVVKFAALAWLLYSSLWLALLVAVLIAAAWSMRDSPSWTTEDEQPEWREGHGGFGLYDKNEWRHDMGDPDK